jgi:hypothetical protein
VRERERERERERKRKRHTESMCLSLCECWCVLAPPSCLRTSSPPHLKTAARVLAEPDQGGCRHQGACCGQPRPELARRCVRLCSCGSEGTREEDCGTAHLEKPGRVMRCESMRGTANSQLLATESKYTNVSFTSSLRTLAYTPLHVHVPLYKVLVPLHVLPPPVHVCLVKEAAAAEIAQRKVCIRVAVR